MRVVNNMPASALVILIGLLLIGLVFALAKKVIKFVLIVVIVLAMAGILLSGGM